MPRIITETFPIRYTRVGRKIVYHRPDAHPTETTARKFVIYAPHADKDFQHLRADFDEAFRLISPGQRVQVTLENGGLKFHQISIGEPNWERAWEVELLVGTLERNSPLRSLVQHRLRNLQRQLTQINWWTLMAQQGEIPSVQDKATRQGFREILPDIPVKVEFGKKKDTFTDDIARYLYTKREEGHQIELGWEFPPWKSIIWSQRGSNKRNIAYELTLKGYVGLAVRAFEDAQRDSSKSIDLRDQKLFGCDLQKVPDHVVVVRGTAHMGGEKYSGSEPVEVFCSTGVALAPPLEQSRLRHQLRLKSTTPTRAQLSLGELSFWLFYAAQNSIDDTLAFGPVANCLWSCLSASEIQGLPARIQSVKDYAEDLQRLSLSNILSGIFRHHPDPIVARTAQELFGDSE